MRNTGYKRFLNVEEFYVSNDQPTGRIKANPAPGELHHAPPIEDLTACPLPGIVTSMEKREYWYREVDGPGDADIYDYYYYPIIITTNSPDPTIKKWYFQIDISNAYESFPSTINVPANFTGTDNFGDIEAAINPPQAATPYGDSLVAGYNVDNYTFTF